MGNNNYLTVFFRKVYFLGTSIDRLSAKKTNLMKNSSALIIFIFSLALIVSSCGSQSGISVTKRHYRNGYNVELGKGRAAETAGITRKSEKTAATKSEIILPESEVTPAPVTNDPANVSAELAKQSILANAENTSTSEIKTATADKPEIKSKKTNKLFSEGTPSLRKVIRNSGVKEMIRSNSNTTSASADGGGGLLWTIIAILLVLWLIGLLTGTTLGGLIYILLVVALVLVLIRLLGRL